jgi:hypothetical protein
MPDDPGVTTRFERQVARDRKRLLANSSNANRRAKGVKLLWSVYARHIATGETAVDIAQHFNISPTYTRDLIRRGQLAMEVAKKFDPNAGNLHAEMIKFVPLAALSLEKNLQDAHPAVTIAFLQGIGALVPKSEITQVTDAERVEQLRRSSMAINPKLKRALGIEDGVEVTIVPEKDYTAEEKPS